MGFRRGSRSSRKPKPQQTPLTEQEQQIVAEDRARYEAEQRREAERRYEQELVEYGRNEKARQERQRKAEEDKRQRRQALKQSRRQFRKDQINSRRKESFRRRHPEKKPHDEKLYLGLRLVHNPVLMDLYKNLLSRRKFGPTPIIIKVKKQSERLAPEVVAEIEEALQIDTTTSTDTQQPAQ